MSYHAIFAILVCITALASFINDRYLRLPKTIALIIISIMISILVSFTNDYFFVSAIPLIKIVSSVDFKTTVLDVMLGYLLFASALHINSIDLKKVLIPVCYLATFGVLISTFFTGIVLWKLSHLINFPLNLSECIIFGALISPTDPIAVIATFKSIPNTPSTLKMRISGEALFNDAVGILVLVILAQIFYGNSDVTAANITIKLLHEALGGILWGISIGVLASLILSRTENSEVTTLTTIAVASAGYILAEHLGVSGAITMVVAGLVVGNYCKQQRFSEITIATVNRFWQLVDEILNAFMFVLIGLEIITIKLTMAAFIIGAAALIIIFISRMVVVILPQAVISLLTLRKKPVKYKESILMAWGGIRGGISVALAIGMPYVPESTVAITYVVVIASILIQGSTFKWIIHKLM